MLSIQPRSSSGGGQSREEVIEEKCTDLQSKSPPLFDVEACYEKYPTSYNESMNTVLVQELAKYNRLLGTMGAALKNIKRALKGEVVMSADLEAQASSIFDN